MSKLRRTILSDIVTPIRKEPVMAEAAATESLAEIPQRRRNATRETTVQQTVYLPPAVHEQLRELAFSERVKMHALLMEGLDSVFRSRGLKTINDLTTKQ